MTILLFQQDGNAGGPDFEPYSTDGQEKANRIADVAALELR